MEDGRQKRPGYSIEVLTWLDSIVILLPQNEQDIAVVYEKA